MKKWGLIGLGAVSLLAWGIVTGWWGMVFLSAYILGSFISWAMKQAQRQAALIIVLLMIPTLDSKIEAVKRWQDEAQRRVIAEARAFEAEILDYNTEEQLFRAGQGSTGQAIRPPYTAFTTQIKQAKGQPTNRVTLRDSGDFHESFRVDWQATQFGITATDPKTPALVAKYGREVFGLNDKGIQELIELLRGPVADNLRKELEV